MKFYAEHETDKIIRQMFFPDFNYKGIIVEVGGATPEFLSMSKHFQDNGWRAIVIEPNPKFVKNHNDCGNEVYEFACSNYDGTSDFTIIEQNIILEDGGNITDHSYSSLSLKKLYEGMLQYNKQKNFEFNYKIIKTKVKKLDTFFAEQNIINVDILSIDTEGWELEVMEGLDTNKINCKVIVIENLFHDPGYTEFMSNRGYTLSNRVEYNYIYSKY